MPRNTQIPTDADWGNYQGHMEMEWAHDKFSGKSIRDAMPFFIVNSVLCAVEAISYMPEKPFRYYILAFKTLFLDENVRSHLLKSGEPSDAANSFLLLVKRTLQDSPNLILPVMDELIPAVNYVAENQDLFRVRPHIYGNLMDIRNDIILLISTEKLKRKK